MYYEGRGAAKDKAKAIRQFRKAAKLGHTGAQNNIKRMGETLY
jgi:TPR repeat protein